MSEPTTIIGDFPPQDGREWEPQCARCGSSCGFDECENCGGEGTDGHDCGEDCCMCRYPEDNVRCDCCLGKGGWWSCLSTEKWCKDNPRVGRENHNRGMIEWYTFDEPHHPGGKR